MAESIADTALAPMLISLFIKAAGMASIFSAVVVKVENPYIQKMENPSP